MALQPKPRPSFEDRLAGARAAIDTGSEYVVGEVTAVTGARESHNAIVTNIHTRAPGDTWTLRDCTTPTDMAALTGVERTLALAEACGIVDFEPA
jgi:hypothetical protein